MIDNDNANSLNNTSSRLSEIPASQNLADSPYPSNMRAWATVLVLMLAFTVSFIDRQILSLMVDPIKTDLKIDEFQISLLHGFAFVIFYTLFGFPLGRLADKANRRNIILAGVLVWSLMTYMCGLATSFTFLFLARVGVGIGEAALTPAAHSTITDSFPSNKRALPLSIYSYGIFLGVGMAFIFGGIIVDWASDLETMSYPIIGEVAPWNITFLVCAALGIPILLLLLFCKEPARHDLLKGDSSTNADAPSLLEVARTLKPSKRIYISLIAASAFNAIIFYGLLAWIPSHFIRHFDFTPAQFGVPFGIIVCIVGLLAMTGAGSIADRLISKGQTQVYEKLMLISLILSFAPSIVATLLPTPQLAFFALGVSILFMAIPIALAPPALHKITPNRMRGVVTALYLFVVNIIGLGCGPTFIATITQYGFKDVNMVGNAISITCAIFLPIAIGILFFGCFRPFKKRTKITLQ